MSISQLAHKRQYVRMEHLTKFMDSGSLTYLSNRIFCACSLLGININIITVHNTVMT